VDLTAGRQNGINELPGGRLHQTNLVSGRHGNEPTVMAQGGGPNTASVDCAYEWGPI